MTDYTRGTGSSGTMMIRDTGSTIEFWLNSNNSTTWSDHIPWSGTVNGSGVSGSFYYHPNSGWQRLGVWGVSTSQNVTFNLGNTGTSGFGGPTTLGPVFINRASYPAAPSAVSFSSLTSTSVVGTFADGSNNGAAIDDRMFGYGTDPANQFQNTLHGGNSATISGLAPGTLYYFWAVTHNSQGWSPWGPRTEITTLNIPDAPSAPSFSELTQVSVRATFSANADGGTPIIHAQIGYGTSPSAPTTFSDTTTENNMLITGLSPGTNYYFWVRVENSIGWSAWSAVSNVTTIAGAWVKVGTVFKPAVPYVRTGGVWKVARPWSRVAGEWKETT